MSMKIIGLCSPVYSFSLLQTVHCCVQCVDIVNMRGKLATASVMSCPGWTVHIYSCILSIAVIMPAAGV